jgi:DNA-binding MarR family transcriptional regulator
MADKKTIKQDDAGIALERDILKLLSEHGECMYGEIIKKLKISSSKGQTAIFSLLKQGLIHVDKSSLVKLNKD